MQLVKPSMLNFAKTDAELRPACALLILTTYTRIKKHLLTNWHAWINHRAILKGTMNPLSWQTWQFSLKWQMSSEWKKATRSVIISGIIRRTIKHSAEDGLCFCFFVFFHSRVFSTHQNCSTAVLIIHTLKNKNMWKEWKIISTFFSCGDNFVGDVRRPWLPIYIYYGNTYH